MAKNSKIKVGIIGVGNCAKSLVEGVQYYAENKDGEARDVCEAVFTMVAVKKSDRETWEKVSHGRTVD